MTVALLCEIGAATAIASPTVFGSLSNMDVINNTGQECRGFEIELDGVSPSQVSYTFGAPYNRYGNPTKIAMPNGAGTIVRYASTFDVSAGTWSAGTRSLAGTETITTGGHQLFKGGDPNYLNEPGDHFGVTLTANPTTTLYRWLSGSSSGSLSAIGSSITLPTPTWTVQAPIVNQAAPAAVQAQIVAPPPVQALFGEAIWAKVFYTESPELAQLDQLVVGKAAPGRDANGNEIAGETEVEWTLLQANLVDKLDSAVLDMQPNNLSVTRRYEFYKYTGTFDSDGQALEETPIPDANSASGFSNVGGFMGAQNAAINLAPVPEPGTLALLNGLVGILLYARYRHKTGAVNP